MKFVRKYPVGSGILVSNAICFAAAVYLGAPPDLLGVAFMVGIWTGYNLYKVTEGQA